MVLGIWYGYDDGSNVDSSESKVAKQIWADTMENYFKNKTSSWYEIPEDVVGVLINPVTGELANETDSKKHICYYLKGTEPGSTAGDNLAEDLVNAE